MHEKLSKLGKVLRKNRLAVFALSCLSMLLVGVTAGAESNSTVSVSDFQSIITALTGQISVATIVAVIAAVIGVTVGIAFMWWGARYASRKIMAALKKGRTGA